MSKKKDEVFEALKKRALGHTVTEESEEYSADESGTLVLTKRKVSVKEIPPELSAIKLLMQAKRDEFDDMSEQELEQEKKRLLKELKKENGG